MSNQKRQKVMLISLGVIAAVAAGAWWLQRDPDKGNRVTTQTGTEGRRTREVQKQERKQRSKPRRQEAILDEPRERREREEVDRDSGDRKRRRRGGSQQTKKKKIAPAAYMLPEEAWTPSDPFEPLDKPMIFA